MWNSSRRTPASSSPSPTMPERCSMHHQGRRGGPLSDQVPTPCRHDRAGQRRIRRRRRLGPGTGTKTDHRHRWQGSAKSGSDGGGLDMMHSLGHSLTDDILPALVPLILPGDHPLRNSRASRYRPHSACSRPRQDPPQLHQQSAADTLRPLARPPWTSAATGEPPCSRSGHQTPCELPAVDERIGTDSICQSQQSRTPVSLLKEQLAERFAKCLRPGRHRSQRATRSAQPDQRRSFARTCTNLTLPIEGDRGFTHAEVTMGGVPLSEVRLENMESRIVPAASDRGDPRCRWGIGGFNFQWAWATGYIAGTSFLKKDSGESCPSSHRPDASIDGSSCCEILRHRTMTDLVTAESLGIRPCPDRTLDRWSRKRAPAGRCETGNMRASRDSPAGSRRTTPSSAWNWRRSADRE